jgi:hypothetical protein
MVSVWLHRWEWSMCQQMLSLRQQEVAAAGKSADAPAERESYGN